MKNKSSFLVILCLALSIMFLLCGCSLLDMTLEIGGSVLSEIGGLITAVPGDVTSTETDPEVTADAETLESIRSAEGDYGYRYIENLSNPAERKSFYESLRQVCEVFHDGDSDAGYDLSCRSNESFYRSEIDDLKKLGVKVVSEIGVSGLSKAELFETYNLFREDHPLFYWLSGACVYYSISSKEEMTVPVLCTEDFSESSVRKEMNASIKRESEKILDICSGYSSEYARALAVHDAVIDRIDYKTVGGVPSDDISAHCITGWADSSGCVCDGYSRTFQMMMNMLGIDCVTVSNTDHAWNLICLEGYGWYWVDVTYDETSSGECRVFFCRNDTEDIFAGTSYIGSGNFLENKHELLEPGGSKTKAKNGYTYEQLGLIIVPALPERAALPYSGPTE